MKFKFETIVAVYAGYLLTDLSNMQTLMKHILQTDIYTHQLNESLDLCKIEIERQHSFFKRHDFLELLNAVINSCFSDDKVEYERKKSISIGLSAIKEIFNIEDELNIGIKS